jgi:hypothetical protein
MRRLIAILIAALAFGALSGFAAYQKVRPLGDGIADADWQEIAWPFPRDAWPAGRAFRCRAAACGEGAELYVRPKIGFCNCDSGVADDDEVDRVADLDMISPNFVPRAAGRVLRVAELSGRARAYDLDMPDGSHHAAIGVALAHRCDLLVAVAQGKDASSGIERAALAFLGTRGMARWMAVAMGGRGAFSSNTPKPPG